MSSLTSPSVDEREQAVEDWTKQTNASVVAVNRKKKLNGIAIGVVAVVFLCALYFLKGGDSKSNAASTDANLTVAPRKVVPILKDDQAATEVPPVSTPTPETQAVDQLHVQREQIEMQRQEKKRLLLEARTKSAIAPNGVSEQADASLSDGQQSNVNPAALGDGDSGGRGAQDNNSRFSRAVSGNGVPVSQGANVANLEYKILQGKVIEGITIPRAISDLPGTICALIQRDVYAERGRLKLIPWGSRMCGVYSAELRKGQSRIFTMWNTLRVSNNDGSITEVALDSIGSDQLGTSGMGGIVDTHFAEIFGTSALLSIIGAGAANAGVSPNDQNNSSSQYRQSVQQAAAQTSQSILAPYINMPPTITTLAGSRVRIFVNRDLDFSQIYKKQIETAKQQDDVILID